MANLFVHKERRVVPNWRSFGKTTVLGELDSFQINRINTLQETSIEEYLIDFNFNQTVYHAADLIGAALVNNKADIFQVSQAAKFILDNRQKATKAQIELAQTILYPKRVMDISSRYDEIGISTFIAQIDPKPLYQRIKSLKDQVKKYPGNAVSYVELSRYYSILGQESQAVAAMKTALHLASNNRFVLRSAVRLFAHYDSENNDYIDYIHSILRNNFLTSYDPWLTSAEISIATIRGRNSSFIKKGLQLINSGQISPFNYTELASGLGTVELLNGSHKKSRELFKKSLKNPNDNSLAQIEWASTKDNSLEVAQKDYHVKMNFEALALENYQNNNFDEALDNAAKWFADQPFSKRPIMFGSNLASTILKDQNKSIAFLNAGLISHPNDPQLLNNLAYALALDDNPNEALKQLARIKPDSNLDQVTKVCIEATKGLALFRSGQAEIGRQYYQNAIKKTSEIGNRDLQYIAILNYAREEILQKAANLDGLMEIVDKIPDNTQAIEIRSLKKDVQQLFKDKVVQ